LRLHPARNHNKEGLMKITKRKEEKAMVIAVEGRLDAVSAPDFDKELDTLIEAGEKILVLDFQNLEYISSAGLRSILAVTKRLRGLEGRIALSSLKDIVREVFQISGFNKIIPIYDSPDEALSEL
ncbi:MAG TPA: STAS domain-containing protein, partial [Syntrophales bacterium]|nr:STAS domain-containing protein [Syntrophales bacterium]